MDGELVVGVGVRPGLHEDREFPRSPNLRLPAPVSVRLSRASHVGCRHFKGRSVSVLGCDQDRKQEGREFEGEAEDGHEESHDSRESEKVSI